MAALEKKIYCHECRAAGMKNDFAIGKLRPAKGWKKEYLRGHAKMSDHSRFAVQAFAITLCLKCLNYFHQRKKPWDYYLMGISLLPMGSP